jgi:hypothetical protein
VWIPGSCLPSRGTTSAKRRCGVELLAYVTWRTGEGCETVAENSESF